MNKETLQLFRTLTELQGTSGFEHDVRSFMKQELSKYADEIVQDGLGSVFGLKKGDETGPRVLVAGHMDEVGFMVTQITKNGMLRFQTLGGQVEPSTISSACTSYDEEWSCYWGCWFHSSSFIK